VNNESTYVNEIFNILQEERVPTSSPSSSKRNEKFDCKTMLILRDCTHMNDHGGQTFDRVKDESEKAVDYLCNVYLEVFSLQ